MSEFYYLEIGFMIFLEKMNPYIDMWLKSFLSCILKDKKYWGIRQTHNTISLTQIMLISCASWHDISESSASSKMLNLLESEKWRPHMENFT